MKPRLAELPFWSRHRGPFSLSLTVDDPTKPEGRRYSSRHLDARLKGPEVEVKALALLGDPKSDVVSVHVWDEGEQQFVFGYTPRSTATPLPVDLSKSVQPPAEDAGLEEAEMARKKNGKKRAAKKAKNGDGAAAGPRGKVYVRSAKAVPEGARMGDAAQAVLGALEKAGSDGLHLSEVYAGAKDAIDKVSKKGPGLVSDYLRGFVEKGLARVRGGE